MTTTDTRTDKSTGASTSTGATPDARRTGATPDAAHRVAVIGGDGIGPEVVAVALDVVSAAGIALETTELELGADHYRRTKEVLPDKVLDLLRDHDAILLGAVGPPIGDTSIPPGTLERGLLLRLRFELDLYVNLRPFRAVPGSIGAGAEFEVVRENTEGAYAGEGGVLRKGTPNEIATQGSVNTRMGVERCVRFAFELARHRTAARAAARAAARDAAPPAVTLVHKTNVLTFAGDLWQRTFDEVGAEYPEVATGYQHVDAACISMVERPTRYGVIVTDNLFGDILTDLAGAVCGGIGYAASANLNPARTGPSLFEPVHGAAHDIAGTGAANPIAAISSAVLMLEHLGETDAAARIAAAVQSYTETEGNHAQPTRAVGDAIAERL